jgi:hypothetical protein
LERYAIRTAGAQRRSFCAFRSASAAARTAPKPTDDVRMGANGLAIVPVSSVV